MILRPMVPKDLSDVAKVNVDTMRKTQPGIIPDAFMDSLSYKESELRFQRLLDLRDLLPALFVVEDTSKVVGYAMGGLGRESVPNYRGELYGIYILPPYHSQGIGRRLVKLVARHLEAQELHTMFVAVFSANIPAVGFYEALGGKKLFVRTIALGGSELPETILGWDSLTPVLVS